MTTTILVIDNSEDDQHLYRQTFNDSDTSFSLIMVTSAEAGLGLIADTSPDVKRPDLILLDCNLPDLDGLGFIRRVSTCSPVPVPIIMLDKHDNVAAVEVINNGAGDYIVKDVEGCYLRRLPGAVARVMGAHKQRQRTQRMRLETETLLLRNQRLMQDSMDGIHVLDMQGRLRARNFLV